MNLNHYSTKDYENKLTHRTPAKQTQSNPILSASGGFKMAIASPDGRHTCSRQAEKSPCQQNNGCSYGTMQTAQLAFLQVLISTTFTQNISTSSQPNLSFHLMGIEGTKHLSNLNGAGEFEQPTFGQIVGAESKTENRG